MSDAYEIVFKDIADCTKKEISKVKNIYKTSFIPQKKASFSSLKGKTTKPFASILVATTEKDVLGFSFSLYDDKNTIIYYLAVNEEERSNGVGSQIVEELKSRVSTPLWVICESVKVNSINGEERQQRRDFYEKMGFEDSPFILKDKSGDYDFLSIGDVSKVKRSALLGLVKKMYFLGMGCKIKKADKE